MNDGYRPHAVTGIPKLPPRSEADPGEPPNQGSSGSKPAQPAAITHAQAERIIALLERIEARLAGGRAA